MKNGETHLSAEGRWHQLIRLQLELGIDLVTREASASSRGTTSLAVAKGRGGNEVWEGYGCGDNEQLACTRAFMEYLERSVQFGCTHPRIDRSANANELGDEALDPESLGLYDPAQYLWPGFLLSPFDPRAHVEWVKVEPVSGGRETLVPVEFIYPRSIVERKLLVAESSSGTAAHFDRVAALVAALCELIERDCFMVFWYRQPPTLTLPLYKIECPIFQEDLSMVQALGWLIVVCDLNYDLAVPCFLAIGLRGSQVACGLGCSLSARTALGHAFHELIRSISYQPIESEAPRFFLPLSSVRIPEDHRRLYTSTPWNELLRDVLARVLRPGVEFPKELSTTDNPNPPAELSSLLDVLAARGFTPYWRDLSPESVRRHGLWVVRTVVPGLIPIHFGGDRLRMACARLRGTSAPGRFQTLLPHFFA
jgi:ribosomal protein S12 methylthiotransferase accessory factor